MKEFWKDYGKFYKKHWKGCALLNAAIVGAEFAWIFRDQIKDKIEEKFHKEDGVQ